MRAVSDRAARGLAENLGLNKPDLAAVVDALDTWIDDNAGAVNAAIPEPGKSVLSQSQKAAIFAAIALKRYGG